MDTPDDDTELLKKYYEGLAEENRQQLEDSADLIEAFRTFARGRGVVLEAAAFAYVRTIGIVATAPGLVTHLIEPLPRERDGLIPFSTLAAAYPPREFQPGYFEAPNFLLMAHPFFRRNMHDSANFAPRFLDTFWHFERDALQKYIALDEDRVRINTDTSSYLEMDTWYGAPFTQDIENIPVGLSKLRPPADLDPTHVSFFFAGSHCLDIRWTEHEGIKTFQALEVKADNVTLEPNGQRLFPARYLHAEYDLRRRTFRHFDGAVQLFTESEYLQRRDSDLNYNAKTQHQVKARSKKIFKFNGPMTVPDWVEFCCQFMPGNPLVLEYFGGEMPSRIRDIVERLRASKAAGGP